MHERRESRIPEEVTRYYQEVPEEGRLAMGPSKLEFERTKEVVLRHLASPPALVLDVGGAAAPYSLWLAEKGYEMHLVDASPRLVDEAQHRSAASSHPIKRCQVGDARELPFEDGAADAVLLLGPLYHLTEAEDRLRALREAHRVLRRGGLLIAATISRYASALDGMSRGLLGDPAFAAIVQRDLEEGQHRNETGRWDYFTTAYFHRPEDLHDEVTRAGFQCEPVLGVEGPGWMLQDFDERWADEAKREELMRVARALETEASVVGVSAHLLAVGRKA